MPDKVTPEDAAARVFHHWFVQYNPLYFFSALCVLAGMFLISRGMEDWDAGQVFLACVMQTYELLLIAGAALLFKMKRQRRPAVILALVAVFFLLDPTLRTEGLAMFGTAGIFASAVWLCLLLAKLLGLRYAFSLRLSLSHLTLPLIGGLALIGVPQLLQRPDPDPELLIVAAAWLGAALAAAALWYLPPVRCELVTGDWGKVVLSRATRAAGLVWAGIYLYHLIAWIGIYEVQLSMAVAVPYLILVPMAFRREDGIWCAAAGVLGAALLDPGAFADAALPLAMVLAWRARGLGLPRLYVGAVLCAYLGLWTVDMQSHTLPEPNFAINFIAAGALLALAWRLKVYSALPAALLCLLPGSGAFLPRTAEQWGSVLLALGFIVLLGGFAINWCLPGPSRHNE